MATSILQANLNHAARAQDLLLQSMAEWAIQIAVIAEPYFIPPRSNWAGDYEGTVAIVSQTSIGSQPFKRVLKGHGCVLVDSGDIAIIGVYFSPNKSLAEFERMLDEVGVLIRQAHPIPVLLAGDLNAKSRAWGSRDTNARGTTLEEWALAVNLEVINRGSVNTCVRQQGGSIVDVTFASPALARRIQEWKVQEDVETLSDHRYIHFKISDSSPTPRVLSSPSSDGTYKRWSTSKLDVELAKEAAIVEAWVAEGADVTNLDVELATEQMREALTRVCDASMPRANPVPNKRKLYWWKPELRQLRKICVAMRRRYARYRRRRIRNQEHEQELYADYRTSCSNLQNAIKETKESSWESWLETLDNNPWGRPYKTVVGKLRPWAPPLTSTIESPLLEQIVASLFPDREAWQPPLISPPTQTQLQDQDIPPVSAAELEVAVRRMRSKNTTPGLDGIPGRIIALAMESIDARVRSLFTECFVSGCFPSAWKTGKLVLLQKNGRPIDSPSAYRPIVLLDEMSKLFERVLTARLVKHLTRVGPDIHDAQYGFRMGRSTLDAITRVRVLSEETVSQGGVVLAVSLDIANAFNTLPWETIKEALKYHAVPLYLRNVIQQYFSDRVITYPTSNGWSRRTVTCGVPQGSVLGPLLWNIGYDWVIRGENLRGIHVTCYADDTLVTAQGEDFRKAAILATAGVAQIVQRIKALGLRVALEKSEAIFFHGPRKSPPEGMSIVISGTPISIKPTLRYLGIVLDGRWRFTEHFRQLAPRAIAFAGVLGRLLPNLGGPSLACRRLYCGVVRSKMLYGAPIWANALNAENKTLLRRPQRAIALRAARAYSTVSFEGACLLAGTPPWDLDAESLATIYRRITDMKQNGDIPLPEEIRHWRTQARKDLLRKWSDRLDTTTTSLELATAIKPELTSWTDRKHGALTFHLTQMLTGHGCFGRYLCRVVSREPSSNCHHCTGDEEDTAHHTRAVCPAWTALRATLEEKIGADMSLSAWIKSMVESEDEWNAVSVFAEAVMTSKESAERAREEDTLSQPIRRRRTGRRRLAFNRILP